jgi:hypothetical protein
MRSSPNPPILAHVWAATIKRSKLSVYSDPFTTCQSQKAHSHQRVSNMGKITVMQYYAFSIKLGVEN